MAYLFSRTKTYSWLGGGARVMLVSSASLGLGFACGGQTTERAGDGDVSTSGDGDGDTTATTDSGDGDTTTTSTTGDGDGDTSTTTSGDGDGDASTGGGGNGDGDTTSSGDGDGDGDGNPSACVSDDDCVLAAETDAPCYSPTCSTPIAALRSDLASDPCLVEWGDGEAGPSPTFECQFQGEIACLAVCAQPPACTAAYCTAHGTCALRTGDHPNACENGVGDATCDELEDIFDQALARAQTCLAGGVAETDECDEALTVVDLCGCPHAVSSDHPVDAGDALGAQVAYNAQCKTPERCALVDCIAQTESASCELTEHPNGVCRYN